MRAFPDTNVLASAFGTRGLCADVVRLVLQRNELITGEILLGELRATLSRKFRLLVERVDLIEQFLREFHVEPEPKELSKLKLRDHSDLIVISTAVAAKAVILITGDKELLSLSRIKRGPRILSLRQFWNVVAQR